MQGRIYPYPNVSYPLQGLVSLDGRSTLFSNEGSDAYLHHNQFRVSEEVYYTSFPRSPDNSAFQYGTGINGYEIPHHGSLQPPSTFHGDEIAPHPFYQGPAYDIPPNSITPMGIEAIYNPSQGYAPLSALPDQSHQYTPVDVPDLPASSTPTRIPATSTTASPASSDDSESPEMFPCPDAACPRHFKRKGCARRHFKVKHNPARCYFSSCNFKWGRKYVYKDHLKRRHGLGNVVINTMLN